jgi:hypothetical protein
MLVYQRVSDHESSSLSSVSDSNLYILQYRRRAELKPIEEEKKRGYRVCSSGYAATDTS